jgi:hypothetical protein
MECTCPERGQRTGPRLSFLSPPPPCPAGARRRLRIPATIPLHLRILADPDFQADRFDTNFIKRFGHAAAPAAQ